MGPREELVKQGRPGPLLADLLYKTVNAVAYHYPPPPGSTKWDKSARQDLAHEFLARKGSIKRLIKLVTRTVDERGFAAQLEKAVRNFCADKGRRTDLGKVIVRVTQVLSDNRAEGRFLRVDGGRWALPSHSTAPTSVPERDLVRAMIGVKVVVPKWTSETRDAPLADGDSFVHLLESVLTAADGSMTAQDLAFVLTKRLNHIHAPLSLDAEEGDEKPIQQHVDADPGVEAVATVRAEEFFTTMDDRERMLVATRHLNSRDAAATVGLGHSQVSNILNRVCDRLRLHIRHDEHGARCIEKVFRHCDEWLGERTRPDDPTLKTMLKAREEEGSG